jgi:hypothetical protein
MAEWGHPEDFQMQKARNAMRDVYEGTDWYQLPYKNYRQQSPDNTMNITNQNIG